MATNLVCNECGGEMEIGFIPDLAYLTIGRLSWVEGKPEKEFWSGMKMEGKKRFYVTAYRCERCGLLKFYGDSEQPTHKQK